MQRTVGEVNAMRYNSVSSSSREEVDLVETESGPKSVPSSESGDSINTENCNSSFGANAVASSNSVRHSKSSKLTLRQRDFGCKLSLLNQSLYLRRDINSRYYEIIKAFFHRSWDFYYRLYKLLNLVFDDIREFMDYANDNSELSFDGANDWLSFTF